MIAILTYYNGCIVVAKTQGGREMVVLWDWLFIIRLVLLPAINKMSREYFISYRERHRRTTPVGHRRCGLRANDTKSKFITPSDGFYAMLSRQLYISLYAYYIIQRIYVYVFVCERAYMDLYLKPWWHSCQKPLVLFSIILQVQYYYIIIPTFELLIIC